MWQVYEHRQLARRLRKLPPEIIKRYEKWKDIIAVSGPAGLREIPGLHDEALRGNWFGYRSSRLNRQYRVIYKIETERVLVYVVDVNPHEY